MKIFLHYLWAAALVCVGCNADVKTKSVAAAINCEQNALAPECLDQMAQGKIGARVIEGMIRSKELEDGTINAAEVNSTNPLFTFTPPSGVTVAYSAPIVTGSLDPITCNIKRPDCSLVDVPLVMTK